MLLVFLAALAVVDPKKFAEKTYLHRPLDVDMTFSLHGPAQTGVAAGRKSSMACLNGSGYTVTKVETIRDAHDKTAACRRQLALLTCFTY